MRQWTLDWLIYIYIPYISLSAVSTAFATLYTVRSLGNEFFDVEGIDRQHRFPDTSAVCEHIGAPDISIICDDRDSLLTGIGKEEIPLM